MRDRGTGIGAAAPAAAPVASGLPRSTAVRYGAIAASVLRPRFRRRSACSPFLAVLGPGLIAGIAGNDAGGITTYSVMGATTGFQLLWLFPITVVVLAVVQEMAARLGTVSGQGLSDLIRDRFGVRWTLLAMGVLLLANLANTVAEFAGASAALGLFGVPTRWSRCRCWPSALGLVVMYASYRRLESCSCCSASCS